MKKISLLITLLGIVAICRAQKQIPFQISNPNKLAVYSGSFKGGEAKYTYRQGENKRIYEGDFIWRVLGRFGKNSICTIKGQFINDKMHGKWIEHESSALVQGTNTVIIRYNSGNKDGLSEYEFNTELSHINIKCNYKKGELNGDYSCYEMNSSSWPGVRTLNGQFISNIPVGNWTYKKEHNKQKVVINYNFNNMTFESFTLNKETGDENKESGNLDPMKIMDLFRGEGICDLFPLTMRNAGMGKIFFYYDGGCVYGEGIPSFNFLNDFISTKCSDELYVTEDLEEWRKQMDDRKHRSAIKSSNNHKQEQLENKGWVKLKSIDNSIQFSKIIMPRRKRDFDYGKLFKDVIQFSEKPNKELGESYYGVNLQDGSIYNGSKKLKIKQKEMISTHNNMVEFDFGKPLYLYRISNRPLRSIAETDLFFNNIYVLPINTDKKANTNEDIIKLEAAESETKMRTYTKEELWHLFNSEWDFGGIYFERANITIVFGLPQSKEQFIERIKSLYMWGNKIQNEDGYVKIPDFLVH